MDRVAHRGPLARAAGALKGGHFWNCQHFCRSWRGKPFGEKTNFRIKVSQCQKTERGTLWGFSTSILSQNSKKLNGDPLGKKFPEKSLAVPKKWKGDPLVSPGMVCYAGKQEKPFGFSSLGQMMQFETIKFCRTILVSSCGLKKKKSHYKSRVSLHEAPTKNMAERVYFLMWNMMENNNWF